MSLKTHIPDKQADHIRESLQQNKNSTWGITVAGKTRQNSNADETPPNQIPDVPSPAPMGLPNNNNVKQERKVTPFLW